MGRGRGLGRPRPTLCRVAPPTIALILNALHCTAREKAMPLTLPLVDPPSDPPNILNLQRRYKAKAERVLSDPEFRASQPMNWWTDDLKKIRDAQEAVASNGSLDPWESSVDLPHIDTFDQRFRFRSVAVERSYWLDHLYLVESSTDRIAKFENCGRSAYLYRDPLDGSFVLRSETCKQRICPACRRRYRFAAIERIRALLQDMKPKTWQFITLTVRHTRAPLTIQLEHLKASFRKLRQRTLWRTHCSHGYAVAEITYNSAKDEWHPHLHVIVKCRYLDWRKLRNDWIRVTGGSHAIDCGYVRSSPAACDYVAKYLAKPPKLDTIHDLLRLQDYYDAIRRVRFLLPFGKPPKLITRPALDTPRKLEPIGHLGDLHHRAIRGEAFASSCLRGLARQLDAIDRKTDPDLRRSLDPAASYDPADLLLLETPP